jgi:hypothetical protein
VNDITPATNLLPCQHDAAKPGVGTVHWQNVIQRKKLRNPFLK